MRIIIAILMLVMPAFAAEKPKPKPENTVGGGLGAPKLGEQHSKVVGGILYEKDKNGNWKAVKR